MTSPSRQVRLDVALADRLAALFPDLSLSAAANEVIRVSLDAHDTARVPTQPAGPATAIRPPDRTITAAERGEGGRRPHSAANDERTSVRDEPCRHPLARRIGTRCGVCGDRVHVVGLKRPR